MSFRQSLEECPFPLSESLKSNFKTFDQSLTKVMVPRYNRGMTHSPIPTPLPQEAGSMIVCDGCLQSERVYEEGILPAEWDKVYLKGWVGAFHSCSAKCKEKILNARNEERVPQRPIVLVG